jgi:hypothetical protein
VVDRTPLFGVLLLIGCATAPATKGRGTMQLLIGASDRDGYCAVVFPVEGPAALKCFGKSWKVVAVGSAPSGLRLQARHRVEARISADHVEARVDGRVVLDASIGAETIRSGAWGLGVFDGRAIFANATAEAVTPLPVVPDKGR